MSTATFSPPNPANAAARAKATAKAPETRHEDDRADADSRKSGKGEQHRRERVAQRPPPQQRYPDHDLTWQDHGKVKGMHRVGE
jgi:hypothetical protein